MRLPLLILLAFLFGISAARADVVSDAQALIDDADYDAAAEILKKEIANSPKSRQIGTLNQLLGECYFEQGLYPQAKECFDIAKAKGVADAYRFLGRLAYLDYNFDLASDLYGKYASMKARAKKPEAPEATEEKNQIETARSFLDRVEKIVIIDSIAADFSDFYKAYRIPASAGRLLPPEKIPAEQSRQLASMAFMNESGDYLLWAEPDSIGINRIYESIRLTDGTWHTPQTVGNGLLEGDSDYPFMMADGLTLYFANAGPESIGGYDIFVASRDAATGEYMQPQNLGMPYNSPYDDFMLAIDEQHGVGWWATDRNRLDGKVTIYVFVVNDLRKNYNPDEDDVVSFAKIESFAATQGEEDYSALLAEIADINPEKAARKADFLFPVGKGRVYTSLEDFTNPEAREAMRLLIEAENKYKADEASLKLQRKEFATTRSKSLAEKIRLKENALEADHGRIRRLRSDVYRALKKP